jgi:NADH-quinone oxidoreductase subunit A
MIPLVAYLLLFVVLGIGFIFVHLVAGKFIRPNKPGGEKRTIYECGEPTIGSAWIQFDLRFYVVALLFVIFDVEVAFFFPWAEVFGKANNLVAVSKPTTTEEWNKYGQQVSGLLPPATDAGKSARRVYSDLSSLSDEQFEANRSSARSLAWLALVEIAVFFGVLLVGYAYLWRRGDLAWVRSTLAERPTGTALPGVGQPARPPVATSGSLVS